MEDISTATDTLKAAAEREKELRAADAAAFGKAEGDKILATKYKCPNCGAELTFKPETQDFGCDYCDSHFSEAEIKVICEHAENSIPDADEVKHREEFENHTNIYRCASCGAEIIADDQQTATFCYYCHEPVILAGRLSGEYKPSKVIGFRLTRENAIDKFKNWCSKRWFLPRDFNSEKQLEKMTGLYVPFWVADCDMTANYEAIGKKVRSWSSGSYRYTETKEYRIYRNANIFTDGIPADGESKIDDLLMESIEPFDYKAAKDFSMSYLSGFYADKYDVDKAAVFPRIRNRATEAAKGIIRGSVAGYSSVSPLSERYNIMQTKWQYMILPVWFMTYKYKGEVYSFAVNGQTGKLAGTPPLDKKKLALACAGIAAGVTILGMLIGGFIL
ncbi:MAG: hypothetical protein PUA81_04275 [Oscillospiraceae bacterium]|nr:hypothetical protein [Oscillospiraceae bacterium]